MRTEVIALKNRFRNFYGTLPTSELSKNILLQKAIEQMERMLKEPHGLDFPGMMNRIFTIEDASKHLWSCLSESVRTNRRILSSFVELHVQARMLTLVLEREARK